MLQQNRRKAVKKSALATIGLLASVMTLSACKTEQSSGLSNIPSIEDTPASTPTPAPEPTPPPPGVAGPGPSQGNFKVTATFPFPGITGFLHKESDWNSACEISPTETVQANKDITCVLDVSEFDLYYNTVNVGISVPQGVCSYVAMIPYWFYKYQPGVGPTAIVVNENAAGTRSIGSPLDGSVTIRDNEVACSYNHSHIDGPNCCTGDYTATLNVISGGTTTTTSSGSWGGKIGDCAAGPGADQEFWSRNSTYNTPLGKAVYTTDGLTYSYSVKSPISQEYGTNLASANWVNNHASATLPMPLRQTGIQTGVRAPQLYHTFLCYDSAEEVKMRARLLIREWNLLSELNKKSAGDPDAGTATDPETDYPGNYKNDRLDWNDYSNSVYPGDL